MVPKHHPLGFKQYPLEDAGCDACFQMLFEDFSRLKKHEGVDGDVGFYTGSI